MLVGKFLAPGFKRSPGPERRQQPRGHLRVYAIQFRHCIGNEFITRSILAIEAGRIGAGKGIDDRTHPVRIGPGEILVRHQLLHPVEGISAGQDSLGHEPFVENDLVIAELPVKVLCCLGSLRQIRQFLEDHPEGKFLVAHIVGIFELADNGFLGVLVV